MTALRAPLDEPLRPPLRLLGEAQLFRAHGLDLEPLRAPCACGGLITVPAGEEVAEAVLAHNRTARHAAWRAWREA